MSTVKGDIYSAGTVPVAEAIPEADYNSNFDAVNISIRMKKNNISYHDAMFGYYSDLNNGVTNREKEFIKNYGKGTLDQNFNKFKKDMGNGKNLGASYISTTYGGIVAFDDNAVNRIKQAQKYVFKRIEDVLRR